MTSPIGLWTAAQKPVETSFRSGQRHLENFRCMPGKKNIDSTYMGMERGHLRSHGRSREEAMVARAGSRGHCAINLSVIT